MPLLYEFQGNDREVHVYAPLQWVDYLRQKNAGDRILPLVVVFHEGPWQENAANPQTMADLTRFHEIAISTNSTPIDEDDLLFTVYVGGLATAAETSQGVSVGGWNTGWFSADSCLSGADDVAFVEDVVNKVRAQLQQLFKAQTGLFGVCVDSSRTCLVGWGDGGAMAYRVAAASTTFRGLAVVGASNGGRAVGGIAGNDIRYSPAPFISNSTMVMLHLHGRTDPECVPGVFNTSQLGVLNRSPRDEARVSDQNVVNPVPTARRDLALVNPISDWATYLTGGFTIGSFTIIGGQTPQVRQWSWSGTNGQRVELRLFDGGHVWPRIDPSLPAYNWSASREIWDFFKQYL